MNDLSLHIIDIIQNSVRAGASRIELSLYEIPDTGSLTIIIKDNGKGMTRVELNNLTDPFFTSRTTRRIGMGIPLFKQSVEQTGGTLKVESRQGIGTTVEAMFMTAHIDMPPMGDIAGVFMLTAGTNPHIDFVLSYRFGDKSYSLDTADVRQALQDVPLNAPETIELVGEMIRGNIASLKTI